MSSAPVLREIITALNKAGIPFMVVGSFASNLHGTGRGTQDIDLVISARPEQVRSFLQAVPKDKYYFDSETALKLLVEDRCLTFWIRYIWARKSQSPRQIEDVAGILKVQVTSLDRAYIEKWVRELKLDSQWESARSLAGLYEA